MQYVRVISVELQILLELGILNSHRIGTDFLHGEVNNNGREYSESRSYEKWARIRTCGRETGDN